MKKRLFTIVVAVFLLTSMSACTSQTTEKEKKQDSKKTVVLNKEMIRFFEKGQLKGYPFQAGKVFTMADVEKLWGKPAKMIDNEDIRDYVYHRDGHDIVFTEDENREVFMFKVSYPLSRKDISTAMGRPDQGRIKTGHVLIYFIGDYKVQFERLNENKWWIILFKRNPS